MDETRQQLDMADLAEAIYAMTLALGAEDEATRTRMLTLARVNAATVYKRLMGGPPMIDPDA